MAYRLKDYLYNDKLTKEQNILMDRLYKLRMSGMAEAFEKQLLEPNTGLEPFPYQRGFCGSDSRMPVWVAAVGTRGWGRRRSPCCSPFRATRFTAVALRGKLRFHIFGNDVERIIIITAACYAVEHFLCFIRHARLLQRTAGPAQYSEHVAILPCKFYFGFFHMHYLSCPLMRLFLSGASCAISSFDFRPSISLTACSYMALRYCAYFSVSV